MTAPEERRGYVQQVQSVGDCQEEELFSCARSMPGAKFIVLTYRFLNLSAIVRYNPLMQQVVDSLKLVGVSSFSVQ